MESQRQEQKDACELIILGGNQNMREKRMKTKEYEVFI